MASLRYLNTMLTVLVVLVGVHTWTLWTMTPDAIPAAQAAGIPDAGAQRMQIVDELKLLNLRTEELIGLFKSGKAQVRVILPREEGQNGQER